MVACVHPGATTTLPDIPRSRRTLCPALSIALHLAIAAPLLAQAGGGGAPQPAPGALTRTIAGRVILGSSTLSRDNLQIYVFTAEGGWLVFSTASDVAAAVGDSVRVTGTESTYRGMREIRNALVEAIPAARRSPLPRRVAFGELPQHVGELVEVSAVVVRRWWNIGNPTLLLGAPDARHGLAARAGGWTADTVALFESAGGTPPVDLTGFSEGDQLLVTGVLSRRDETGGHRVLVLLPRVAADVRTMGITMRRKRLAASGALIVVLLLALALAWIAAMRRELRRRTRAFEASEARYRLLFEESLGGNFVSSPAGKVIACNRRFAEIFGFASPEEAVALAGTEQYVDVESRTQLLAAVRADGRVERVELSMRRRDGALIVVEESVVGVFDADGALRELRGFLVDVTQQRHVEGQLRQSQKIESIGRLAGGIAHDFNNLLTVIIAASELALDTLDAEQQAHGDLLEIRGAARRGAELTRQLLAFSRRQVLQPQLLDVGAVLGSLASLIRRLIGESITLTVDLPDHSLDRPPVLVDASQLEQTIINLVVNAVDAMPRGGSIRISLRDVVFDAAWVARHEGARQGRYCRLSVEDTGTGMDAETSVRAFEPFFTTKAVGKGTGLGLSMVFGFVKQSGGYVTLESTPEVGTSVSLYLPLAAPELVDGFPAVAVPAVPTELRRPRARGTALVVEDESPVRAIAARVMRSMGLDVVEAADPLEAGRVMSGMGALTMVLTDVVMPNGGGEEVARLAECAFPGVPVLFMSGYTDDRIVLEGVKASTLHFVAKPFTAVSLTSAVLAVLAMLPEHPPTPAP